MSKDAITLLGAPGIATTRNKKLLGAPGLAIGRYERAE